MRTNAERQSDVVRPFILPSAAFVVGDWLVEPELNRVSRNGTSAHVRPKLMDLLVYLATNNGRTVPQEELLANLWPGQPYLAGTALPRCIAELRQALGDRAAGSTVIQTVPKRGYRLIAKVSGGAGPGPAEPPWEPYTPGSGDWRTRAATRSPATTKPPADEPTGGPEEAKRLTITWLRRARGLAARLWRAIRSEA